MDWHTYPILRNIKISQKPKKANNKLITYKNYLYSKYMGWGDYLMTSGHVRRIKKNKPQIQVLINNPFNSTLFYKHIFYKNPFVTMEQDFNKEKPFIKINRVESGKIDKLKNKIIWNDERVSEIGDIYSTFDEITFAEKFLNNVMEDWVSKNKKKPKAIIYISDLAKKSIKTRNNEQGTENFLSHFVNKEWGKDNWEEFIRSIKNEYIIIKSSANGEKNLDNVYTAECDFRTVKAIMDKSDIFIGNEGGLSHLWATTRKKGIVFFGHWIPPHLTGYSFHLNIKASTNNYCGSLDSCDQCLSFYKNLSPEFIKYNLDKNI